MTLAETIAAANAADDAFEMAVKAAGYKSRWDLPHRGQLYGPLRAAYYAKVDADEAMHKAFEASDPWWEARVPSRKILRAVYDLGEKKPK